jgi:hypothetical protein
MAAKAGTNVTRRVKQWLGYNTSAPPKHRLGSAAASADHEEETAQFKRPDLETERERAKAAKEREDRVLEVDERIRKRDPNAQQPVAFNISAANARVPSRLPKHAMAAMAARKAQERQATEAAEKEASNATAEDAAAAEREAAALRERRAKAEQQVATADAPPFSQRQWANPFRGAKRGLRSWGEEARQIGQRAEEARERAAAAEANGDAPPSAPPPSAPAAGGRRYLSKKRQIKHRGGAKTWGNWFGVSKNARNQRARAAELKKTVANITKSRRHNRKLTESLRRKTALASPPPNGLDAEMRFGVEEAKVRKAEARATAAAAAAERAAHPLTLGVLGAAAQATGDEVAHHARAAGRRIKSFFFKPKAPKASKPPKGILGGLGTLNGLDYTNNAVPNPNNSSKSPSKPNNSLNSSKKEALNKFYAPQNDFNLKNNPQQIKNPKIRKILAGTQKNLKTRARIASQQKNPNNNIPLGLPLNLAEQVPEPPKYSAAFSVADPPPRRSPAQRVANPMRRSAAASRNNSDSDSDSDSETNGQLVAANRREGIGRQAARALRQLAVGARQGVDQRPPMTAAALAQAAADALVPSRYGAVQPPQAAASSAANNAAAAHYNNVVARNNMDAAAAVAHYNNVLASNNMDAAAAAHYNNVLASNNMGAPPIGQALPSSTANNAATASRASLIEMQPPEVPPASSERGRGFRIPALNTVANPIHSTGIPVESLYGKTMKTIIATLGDKERMRIFNRIKRQIQRENPGKSNSEIEEEVQRTYKEALKTIARNANIKEGQFIRSRRVPRVSAAAAAAAEAASRKITAAAATAAKKSANVRPPSATRKNNYMNRLYSQGSHPTLKTTRNNPLYKSSSTSWLNRLLGRK